MSALAIAKAEALITLQRAEEEETRLRTLAASHYEAIEICLEGGLYQEAADHADQFARALRALADLKP